MPPPQAPTDNLLMMDNEHIIQDVSAVNYDLVWYERVAYCLIPLVFVIICFAIEGDTGEYMLYNGLIFIASFLGAAWYYENKHKIKIKVEVESRQDNIRTH
jgi:hypothetical protein